MGVASILIVLAAQAAAAPPPGAEKLPARAVDHVVTMDERRADCATCPLHRRTIARSGSWVRDERTFHDGIETIYSDFASGTSFTLHRSRDGALETLLVERNFEPGGQYRVRREATGRRDNALGEPCEIWALSSALLGTATESCETADGIMLWNRYRDRVSPRAVSVERRPVRPEEVRPPADLFALVQWPRLDREAVPGAGYEVVLTLRRRGVERTTILRRHGNLILNRQEGRDDGGVYLSAGDGTASYVYHVDPQGRATRLEAGLPRLRGWGGSPRWEAVPGRRPQRVLGEVCTWQDETSVWSSDVQYDCRTADGVPLMTETQWHWTGEIEIQRARRVVRRSLTEADLTPPPEARDWANWGVAPPR